MAGVSDASGWVRGDLDAVRTDLAVGPQEWSAYLLPLHTVPDHRPGWLSWQSLSDDPGTLSRHLATMATVRRLPDDGAVIGSTFVLVNAMFMTNVLALAFLGDPVIRLHPGRTHVLVSESGNSSALALTDPVEVAAQHVDPALAARDTIIEHGTPIVEAVRRLTRCTRRAAWSLLASTVSEVLLDFGRSIGEQHRAAAMIDRIVAPGSPLALAPPRRHVVDVDGTDHLWSCRAVCCLYYKARNYCTTVCPLIDESRRTTAIIDALRAR